MAKLLTVFGATGKQGGALVNSILTHPTFSKTFALRGVTRDTSKPAAVALQKRGVEVVEADMDDFESLKRAVAGSYAVFAVTQFWEKADPAVEAAQGKAMADASVATGVSLLIWSSLPSVTKMTNGELTHVSWFDSKADVETYIRGLPITSAFFMAGYYMQNFKDTTGGPKPDLNEDGTYTLRQTWTPTTRLPLIDIADIGKYLAPVLTNPAKYHQKTLTCATAYYTPGQIVRGWSAATGRTVTYEQQSSGEFRAKLPEKMKALLGQAGKLLNEWSYFGPKGEEGVKWTLRQMDLAGDAKPGTWEEYLERDGPWFGEIEILEWP